MMCRGSNRCGIRKRSSYRLQWQLFVAVILAQTTEFKTATAALVLPAKPIQSTAFCHPELPSRLFNKPLENALIDHDDTILEECWAQTSWTVNPDGDDKIDVILQGLVSPAPQSFFVLQRILNKCKINLSPAQQFQVQYDIPYLHLLKVDYDLVVRDDAFSCDRSDLVQPGVDWSLQPRSMKCRDGWTAIVNNAPSKSLNQLATEILEMVQINSDLDDKNENDKNVIVAATLGLMEKRLALTLGTDVRGRAAADTAFVLALAGVVAPTLYRKLYKVVLLELQRVRDRHSRRSKDVLHIIEKVAASGACASGCDEVEQIYQEAASFLEERREHLDVVHTLRMSAGSPANSFNLLSPRPLLWLWRFSSRLTKPRAQPGLLLNDHRKYLSRITRTPLEPAWLKKFDNNRSPLVVDLGCGFGASLLGLASIEDACTARFDEDYLLKRVNWMDCNFLGCDLNPLMPRFANGITCRWNHLNLGRLQILLSSAEDTLNDILLHYQGNVALILLQFPTPYRLQDDCSDGNSQLPASETECMASPTVMAQIANILHQKGKGRLLIQSNCEDVAIRLRNLAIQQKLEVVPADPFVQQKDAATRRTTQRTEKWIQFQKKLGVECERAVGFGWWSRRILPPGCATETEVACEFERIPVHRCILKA